MSDGKNLRQAKKNKNDEFYTQMESIDDEIPNYISHFENKKLYFNCDGIQSNFFIHFANNFHKYKLKQICCTYYDKSNNSYATLMEQDGSVSKYELKGNGDFRSDECVELMKQSDIVVTNPPFSLFREFISLLIDNDKKFLVIGNQNAITYKGIFKLIKENKLWLGKNSVKDFLQPSGNIKKFGNVYWYTNLSHNKRNEKLELYKKYTIDYYPKYDNYDAINVDKVCEIPENYSGTMGVPITFLNVYNKEQFEIVGAMTTTKVDDFNFGYPFIKGSKIYARILIRNKEAK